MTLQHSWLIQRLNKPHDTEKPDAAGNPFAFGGGYVRGGLSKEASEILGTAFEFDYMGAAEYEFGAVPETLSKIAEYAGKNELGSFFFTVPVKDILKDWRDKSKKEPEGSGTIYVLCRAVDTVEILSRIDWWARNEYRYTLSEDEQRAYRTRDAIGLARNLRPYAEEESYYRVAGWLELNNGFFFFTDEDMWRETSAIFGVDVDASV